MKQIKSLLNDTFGEKRFFQLKGKASFKVEVDIKGEAPYCRAILSVQAFSDQEKRIAIATKCNWYRKSKYSRIDLKASGNSYQLSALDVGSFVVVEITPGEEDEKGMAEVTFGPIELDPSTQSTLQTIMRSGGSNFALTGISHSLSRSTSNLNGNLLIFKSLFKISTSKLKEVTIGYEENLDILANPGSKGITFLISGREKEFSEFLGQGVGDKIVVMLHSQRERDLVIMSIRCLKARMDLEDSLVFEKLKNELFEGDSSSKSNAKIKSNLDILAKNNALTTELQFLFNNNSRLSSQNEKLEAMVRNLEGELNRTANCKLLLFMV